MILGNEFLTAHFCKIDYELHQIKIDNYLFSLIDSDKKQNDLDQERITKNLCYFNKTYELNQILLQYFTAGKTGMMRNHEHKIELNDDKPFALKP